MHRLGLRFLGIRAVPKTIVYHHPIFPAKPSEGARVAPVAGIGVVFRAAPPLLERTEEKIRMEAKMKSEEKAKEGEVMTSPVSAQTTS
jgi:hypothetical protein